MGKRPPMPDNDSIHRLAQRIERIAREPEHLLLDPAQVEDIRRRAAGELHAVCADFVDSVNRLLSTPVLELAPAAFAPEAFRDSGSNLMQINGRGRIVQFAFAATRRLVESEKFRLPYTLEGEIRIFNQEMLQRLDVYNVALYFCIEERGNGWHYFDWRTNRAAPFTRDALVMLMERLV